MVYRKPDVDLRAFVIRSAYPAIRALSFAEFDFISEALHFFAGTPEDLRGLFYPAITLENKEKAYVVSVPPFIELVVVIRDSRIWILEAREF